MKVIVVGSTHAGTTAIKEIKTQTPDVEVVVYERNDNVSFLSCGIALYVQGEVKHADELFYSDPEKLAALGADLRMQHEILAIDSTNKTVQVRNLLTGDEFEDNYDKLVMTTGSVPVKPNIPGIDNPNLYFCKNYHDAQVLFEKTEHINSVIIIGAGYIGVELAEAFQAHNKEVTIIDGMPTIMNKYFDEPYTQRATDLFESNGIKVVTGELVQGFTGQNQVTVTTDKQVHQADIVILAIGFKPNTALLKDQVKMLPNGAIVTNEYMQTSNADIYAAGDSTAVYYNPTQSYEYIPLATNAIRQGKLVGQNIVENKVKYMGTQASSGLQLFGMNFVASGLTTSAAKARGLNFEAITIEDNFRPEFMTTTAPVLMTLVWEKASHKILGVQLSSTHDISAAANGVSIAMQADFTIDQLAMVDMLFQPWFDRPFNYLNILAQAAVEKASTHN
ncbi:FAD-dependent oxidoreductase [Periweissella ghanensis]|uniref:NADH oxidase n=1 Tax=Periweissella ghanensis TaxID=467997 RepID=A0ABN8BR64_9LACO|nr:FAD-dependent oxidoreductase [Periweissella ghanensis]MCM0601296.1 FAD-dependent oxidoreductase [Periweissella ghanensis]CAH0419358.1 NADH oxidase [Periweissella ghanensis]